MQLWLVCGDKEGLAVVEEPLPCVHVGILVTPLACVSSEANKFVQDSAPRRKRMAGTHDLHISDEL